jgi:hypothetical protein
VPENGSPPGYTSESLVTPPSALRHPQTWDAPPGWGWAAYLLPHLEEANVGFQLNLDKPIWDPDHANLIRATVPTFLCPSDSGPKGNFVVSDVSGGPLSIAGRLVEVGRSNFVASHGQESCGGNAELP